MRFSINDDELPLLSARLGLPTGVTAEQVEDALVALFAGQSPQPPRPPRPPQPPHGGQNPACEQAIAAAIAEGKITPGRADHYRRRWERDPTGTASVLARLAPVRGLNEPHPLY